MIKPVVSNAANEGQVKRARRKEKEAKLEESNDIKTVASTRQGRRFLFRILEQCKTFASVWHPSAKIHYLSGQQDVGHWLMGEIVDVDEEILFKMMRENKEENS